METIKCTKCGCEMSAMSEACPLCGTPTNKRNSDIKEDTNTLADGFHVPTPEDIENLVVNIPALDDIDKDELDYEVISHLYSFQSKVFPNHFIGCKEVAEILSLSSFSYDELWNYWQTLIELDWGVWPISAVMPQHGKKVKSLVDEYNNIARNGKYADSLLSIRTENEIQFLDGPENGPKKKGLFGGDYTKLREIYNKIISYCDGVILPPQYNK